VLYHKIQEVPSDFFSKNRSKTPGERLIREAHDDLSVESKDAYDLDDSFSPEESHKAYTLCVISNPNMSGFDELF